MERKVQQQTLSIRVPESLRNYLERAKALLSDNVNESVSMSDQPSSCWNRFVTIGYPSITRPHYLERLGPEDGVFIRGGSTNRKAEALQIEELKRLNWRTTFDEQAIPDLKSEAPVVEQAAGEQPRFHRLAARRSIVQTESVKHVHRGDQHVLLSV